MLNALVKRWGVLFVVISTVLFPCSQAADLSAPIIVLSISDPLDDSTESYRVAVEVTDDSQVDWVMLRYRTIGDDKEFSALPMSIDRGEGLYSATIPKSGLKKPGIEYFIEAKDVANNVSQEPFPDQARQIYYVGANNDDSRSKRWWWIAGGALAAGLVAILASGNNGGNNSPSAPASLIIEAPVPGGESAN